MVVALLVIWAVFAYQTDGAFLQIRNISNLLRQTSVTGVLSVGMVLVIVAGQVDLSVGSVVCFLGGLLAVLNTQLQFSPVVSVLAVIGCGLLVGLAQGYFVAFQRVPAFIVTLGGMMVFRGASMLLLRNSTVPLENSWISSIGTAYVSSTIGWVITFTILGLFIGSQISERRSRIKHKLAPGGRLQLWLRILFFSALILGFMAVLASYQGVPVPVLIMLGLMLAIHFVATQTVWGRHIYAIGGNKEAAQLSGVPVQRKTLSTFVLMGFLAAVAGMILTTRIGSASPDAGQLLELDAIAACVIGGASLMGGRGSALGAVLGALVMESLNNGMSMENIEPYWQFIVKGGVLVAAVWMDMMSQTKRA